MDTLRSLARHYADLQDDVARLMSEADMLRDASPSAARLSGMPSGGGDPGDPTHATVARILDLEAQADRKRADVDAVALTICRTIAASVPVAYHGIIRGHYLTGMSYDRLATTYHYAPDHIARLCRRYGSVPTVEIPTVSP